MLKQNEKTALRERVKELSCLYEISLLGGQYNRELKDIIQGIVELIPGAWQYPDIACARITIDSKIYNSSDFKQKPYRQTEKIVIKGKERGSIEVIYKEKTEEFDEGPFLREERHLINSIAKQVALIVEKSEARVEADNLQKQLQHADRLATIGQLTAGLAHELNDPLGHILGFAQIIEKSENLPSGISKDISSIIKASLHAREIVKKLLIFARQMPARKEAVQLNDVIRDGIYFLRARCKRENITLRCRRQPELPLIAGDSALLTQVLVNLVVNAIHAMPGGGKLLLETKSNGIDVLLIVRDTGTGIAADITDKIFMPFFTTKEVGQGTGLGLAVVHGIVTSHGGGINVESKLNHGTEFVITFPALNGSTCI